MKTHLENLLQPQSVADTSVLSYWNNRGKMAYLQKIPEVYNLNSTTPKGGTIMVPLATASVSNFPYTKKLGPVLITAERHPVARLAREGCIRVIIASGSSVAGRDPINPVHLRVSSRDGIKAVEIAVRQVLAICGFSDEDSVDMGLEVDPDLIG